MLIFTILEKAINQYLRFDPEMRARLKKISGSLIRIEMSIIDLSFYLSIHGEHIKVLQKTKDPIDAAMRGSPMAFMQAWLQSWQGKTTVPKDLEITGDASLIQTINDIFSQVEIDWEELLSQYTGDVIAHQMGEVGRSVKNWLSEVSETVAKNFTEYVQEEVVLLPPRMAIEDYCDDVDKLRDDVERLEVRLNNYI